jgi:hypothetical protein
MVGNVRPTVVLFCATALAFLGITPARADQGVGEIPTGQIVRHVYSEGTYVNSNGRVKPIFSVWLRNMQGSNTVVVYTLKPGEPQVGAQYQMSTPDAVRTDTFLPAYWLVQQHAHIGTKLDYWPEQEAIQLAIWGYSNGAILSSERVPDTTVLSRAQELSGAVKEALAKSTPEYQLVHRRVKLSVHVRRSTATKVMIEARLYDLDNGQGLVDEPLNISYDGQQITRQTGAGGMVLVQEPRRDADVEVDANYTGQYSAGIHWVSTNGRGLPVILGDEFPVSFNTQIWIDPSTQTSGVALAYQQLGDYMSKHTPFKSAPGAVIGLIVLAGGWLLMAGQGITALKRRNEKNGSH